MIKFSAYGAVASNTGDNAASNDTNGNIMVVITVFVIIVNLLFILKMNFAYIRK